MLDIEIKHDIDKNYLVIHGSDENTYMLKMLDGNSVRGFLDLEVRVLNNVNQYYYDITGKENFLQKSARSKWTEEELRKMISDVLGCLQKSREYLLMPEHFVLEPQYMYRSMESGQVFLCYAWNYEKNINEQLTELFAYFMNVVDYEDDNAVDLVYKLYDASREENCTLQRLWSVLSVPKVKRVVIEEEPAEEEIKETTTHKTRKPLGVKKQEKKPKPKPLCQKPKKKMETIKKKSESLEKNKVKKEKSEATESPMWLKIVRIVALQFAMIGVIFVGAKYGFFFEDGGISYTKTGGTLLILGVLDMYLMTKIFGVEETEEESKTQKTGQKEYKLSTTARERKIEKKPLSKNRQNTSPFVLAKETQQSASEQDKYLNRELQKKVQVDKRELEYKNSVGNYDRRMQHEMHKDTVHENNNEGVLQKNVWNKEISLGYEEESEDFDGTVVLDYEKTIVDNRKMDLLQNKNKKICYLVPDEKDYSVISLGEFPFFIGRFQKDTGSLKEIKNISRMHSKIEQIGSRFFITDLNSTNGTFVNQKRLEKDKKIELYEGDEVTFANVLYHFTMQKI